MKVEFEPKVRGLLIKSTIEYIENHFGSDAFHKVLNDLNENDRAIISSHIYTLSMEPCIPYRNFLIAIDKIFGEGDFKLCRKMSFHKATYSLPSFFKAYIRMGDPHFGVKHVPIIWSLLYNSGYFKIKNMKKTSSLIRFYDFKIPHKVFCASILGFGEGMAITCGAKNPLGTETKCVLQGAEYCEYILSWEK